MDSRSENKTPEPEFIWKGRMMKKILKFSLLVAIALAVAILLGSCNNYRYYNRYPKQKRCGGCPSFSHMMESTRLT